MNSLYGILALPSFRYFKLENARAITLTGQYIIKCVGGGVNADLNTMFNTDDFEWAYYFDTDSVDGKSLIYLNGEKIAIEDAYNLYEEFVKEDYDSKSFVKPVSGVTTKSFNISTKMVEDKPIKYIMKHKVKKEMFKISIDDKFVICTCDHSIIINRNDDYISVTPRDILPTDKIIHI